MNVAGIVPIAGQPLDLGFPWDDCLTPIAQNYVAVERAVAECLYAGCKSVWIVGALDQQPLIRYRLGDKGKDPESHNPIRRGTRERDVCFYYVPITPQDYLRRNSVVWSSIYGILNIRKIIGKTSMNLLPERYYIAFPYGVYDPRLVRQVRGKIKITKNQVLLRSSDKTVMDGEYLGLSLTLEQAQKLERVLKDKAYHSSEKYAAKQFSLRDVYAEMELGEEIVYLDVDEYYNIDNWEKYTNYMKESSIDLIRPKTLLLQKEWNGIGVDDE